jgi:hypothetical protein
MDGSLKKSHLGGKPQHKLAHNHPVNEWAFGEARIKLMQWQAWIWSSKASVICRRHVDLYTMGTMMGFHAVK